MYTIVSRIYIGLESLGFCMYLHSCVWAQLIAYIILHHLTCGAVCVVV